MDSPLKAEDPFDAYFALDDNFMDDDFMMSKFLDPTACSEPLNNFDTRGAFLLSSPSDGTIGSEEDGETLTTPPDSDESRANSQNASPNAKRRKLEEHSSSQPASTDETDKESPSENLIDEKINPLLSLQLNCVTKDELNKFRPVVEEEAIIERLLQSKEFESKLQEWFKPLVENMMPMFQQEAIKAFCNQGRVPPGMVLVPSGNVYPQQGVMPTPSGMHAGNNRPADRSPYTINDTSYSLPGVMGPPLLPASTTQRPNTGFFKRSPPSQLPIPGSANPSFRGAPIISDIYEDDEDDSMSEEGRRIYTVKLREYSERKNSIYLKYGLNPPPHVVSLLDQQLKEIYDELPVGDRNVLFKRQKTYRAQSDYRASTPNRKRSYTGSDFLGVEMDSLSDHGSTRQTPAPSIDMSPSIPPGTPSTRNHTMASMMPGATRAPVPSMTTPMAFGMNQNLTRQTGFYGPPNGINALQFDSAQQGLTPNITHAPMVPMVPMAYGMNPDGLGCQGSAQMENQYAQRQSLSGQPNHGYTPGGMASQGSAQMGNQYGQPQSFSMAEQYYSQNQQFPSQSPSQNMNRQFVTQDSQQIVIPPTPIPATPNRRTAKVKTAATPKAKGSAEKK